MEIERFWDNVKILGKNDCWEWQGKSKADGYGQVCYDSQRDLAHRLVYRMTYGPIPDGMCICHTCDNRLCCNPAHLWLGTIADNNKDKARKGRASNQFLSGNAKSALSSQDLDDIRSLYRLQELTQDQLAERYGVSQTMVSHIINHYGVLYKL